MSRPSVAELRRVAQPPELVARQSGEHWVGRLYMRKLSPYLTVRLVPTAATPDGVTAAMVVVGVLAAGVLALPGLGWAIATAVGIQVYLLLDCSDGELARWRGTTSPRGVYLDRVGHYLVDAALLVALGARASHRQADGWLVLGLVAALCAVLGKAETDLVDVARSRHGAAAATDTDTVLRSSRMSSLRRVAQVFRVHRLIQAVELSLAALVAAAYDTAAGGVTATRVLVVIAAAVAGVLVLAHLASILMSSRLRVPAD
jgi:phosphatidylglycerophosphate synthase